MPCGPRCCSLPSQMAPVGRSVPNARGRPRLLPEAPLELQQQPRRAAVAEVRRSRRAAARAARVRRPPRAPCSPAARTRSSRRRSPIACPLRSSIVTVTPSARWTTRRTIVSLSSDPRRRFAIPVARRSLPPGMRKVSPLAGHAAFGELLHQRQHRQVLGIGEKEPPEPAHRRLERRRRAPLLEPVPHRRPRRTCAATALSQRSSASLNSATSAFNIFADRDERGRAQVQAPLAARVGAVEAEAVAQDPHRLQPELAGERQQVLLVSVDEVGARFGVLPPGEAVAQRPHPPADAIARFDDRHRRAARLERPRGRQPREPRPANDDARSRQIPSRHLLRLHLSPMPSLLVSLLPALPRPAGRRPISKARIQKLIDVERRRSRRRHAHARRQATTSLIDPDKEFHAASTMKVPVMIELFRQAEAGHAQARRAAARSRTSSTASSTAASTS